MRRCTSAYLAMEALPPPPGTLVQIRTFPARSVGHAATPINRPSAPPPRHQGETFVERLPRLSTTEAFLVMRIQRGASQAGIELPVVVPSMRGNILFRTRSLEHSAPQTSSSCGGPVAFGHLFPPSITRVNHPVKLANGGGRRTEDHPCQSPASITR